MAFLLASLGLFFAGGCAALASGRGQNASRIGAFSAIAASLVGLLPVLAIFADALAPRTAASPSFSPLTLVLCKLPMGEAAFRLDLLGALFLAPVLLLVAVAAAHGMGSGDGGVPREDKSLAESHTGAHWFFYNLLAGGMVLTLTADDAFLFLMAWEAMSLAPFFLILLHSPTAETRSAAWIYVVAAHLGVLLLLAFFALLAAKNSGSLSFAAFVTGAASLEPGIRGGSGLLFLLMLLGFGAKTGFMPLHVWMPESYAAAPSHVAAVMSGAAVNMGVYGIIRAFGFLGEGEAWWAHVLIVVGLAGAAVGILQALAQSGIKRALAFSSVENMGIICLGLGIALLCLQKNHSGAAALAATGAMVHMVNHALSKGLLFLCSGCVLRGTGTVSLRLLGGLQKRMPAVGWSFVLGSAAMTALPPLNGFAGEFFLYLGMVFGGAAFAGGPSPESSLIFWVCLFILAAVGGFTLVCFSRLYGMVFLGAPRTEAAETPSPPARNEIAAICILAAFCVISAVAAPRVAKLATMATAPVFQKAYETAPVLTAAPVSSLAVPPAPALIAEGLAPPRLTPAPDGPRYRGGPDSAIALLEKVNAVFLLFLTAALAAFLLRRRILRERSIGASPTWDCGYIAPTARIQYTAGSYSQPTAFVMRTILRQKFAFPVITEYFPLKARLGVLTPDWVETHIFIPLFGHIARIADKCKELQHGMANGYILYILVTLVALLAWKLE